MLAVGDESDASSRGLMEVELWAMHDAPVEMLLLRAMERGEAVCGVAPKRGAGAGLECALAGKWEARCGCAWRIANSLKVGGQHLSDFNRLDAGCSSAGSPKRQLPSRLRRRRQALARDLARAPQATLSQPIICQHRTTLRTVLRGEAPTHGI